MPDRSRAEDTSADGLGAGPNPPETVVRPEGPVREATMYGPAHDAESRPARAILERGATVGRYVVLETIGTGGMGIVYAAFDPELDRKIALKLLRPGRRRREHARARLLREAQALAKLSHPSVIAVHDVGTYADQVFVAMEFVDGTDMGQWLREQKKTWREVLPLMRQAGEGLAAAHAADVVHRDFKPENVLVGHDGRVRVVDFGLARTAVDDREATGEQWAFGPTGRQDAVRDAPRGVSPVAPTLSGPDCRDAADDVDDVDDVDETVTATRRPVERLTQVGAVMGTPQYMAPEQHRGDTIDARSDQFSFCVALYEALYGQRPFEGSSMPALAYNVLRGNVREPPRDGPAVPAWIRRVIMRGLSVDPTQRWPDMRALLDALGHDPTARRRRGLLAVGLTVTAAAAGAAFVYEDADEDSVCGGARRKLASVWDASIRDRVGAAFRATDRPYAADALAWTEGFLDAYTSRWVQMHTDACEATAIRKEQSQELLDRQMLCLDRRLEELRQLTAILATADAGVVQQSVRAVTRLPPLEPCADRESLMAESPPLDGAQAARVAEIEELLARGKTLRHLARYEAGQEVTRDALGAARALGHPPIIARALILLGRLQNDLAQADEARRTLLEAIWTADEAGEDLVRAEAWKDLLWVVGVSQRRYAETAAMGDHATHALARAGGNPDVEAELHNNLGVVARRGGDTEAAIAHHRQSLSLRREHLEPDDPRIADSLLNLAGALGGAGRLDEAEQLMAEAQGIIEKAYGASHPRMASALHTRGVLAYRREQYRAAVQLLQTATDIRLQTLKPDHPDLATSMHDLGEALLETESYEQARERFDKAIALREANLGPDHPSLANSLNGLGLAHLGLGQSEEAAQSLERALAIRVQSKAAPIALAESRFALARALAARDATRARALAQLARTAYAESGKHATRVTQIDTWLADLADR